MFKFLRFPLLFFGRKKLLLAFEYGLLFADVAKKQGVELTPELVMKAEMMLENEFSKQTATYLAMPNNMVPNLMAPFELDPTK